MLLRRLVLVIVLCGVPAMAGAEVVVDLISNNVNSGWSVVLADNVHNGIVVDQVVQGANSFVRIEISKDLYLSSQANGFTPNVITFRPNGLATPVQSIWIDDENITNSTGQAWTGYSWTITGTVAALDKTLTNSSGFSTNPFITTHWGAAQTGWDSLHPASLSVDGGTVPTGGIFAPGNDAGKLYIDTNVTGANQSFTLSQGPVPEPATLSALLAGALLTVLRRRARPKA